MRTLKKRRKACYMGEVQYIIDDAGKKTAVVIPLKGNEKAVEDFMEDLYGHRKIQERRNEGRIGQKELLKRLKNDGLL